MQTLNIKLSPGNLSDPNYSPFKLPASVWNGVNDFLQKILTISPDNLNYIDDALGKLNLQNFSLYSLTQEAQRWSSSDLPDLKSVAQSIANFGSQTIPDGIHTLKELSPSFSKAGYSPGNVSAFKQALIEINNGINPFYGKIQNLKIDLAQLTFNLQHGNEFLQAVQYVKNEFDPKNYVKPNPVAQALVNDMTAIQQTFSYNNFNLAQQRMTYINGTVDTLASEVSNAITDFDNITFQKNPFMVDDDFNVALSSWQSVAQDALNFHNSLP